MGELWLVELHWGVALSSAQALIQVVDWMHYPKLYCVTPGGLKVRVGTKDKDIQGLPLLGNSVMVVGSIRSAHFYRLKM